MIIDKPAAGQIPQLRQLWKEAFGDEDAFLDGFFATGFSRDRCRCVLLEGCVCAVLYWFDAEYAGQKIAYLYAVATAKAHQGQGLCRALIEDTHRHLAMQGYQLAVLVPCQPSLFPFYEKLGYRTLSGAEVFTCQAANPPATLQCLSAEEYSRRRRSLLPPDAIIQEGVTLDFLQTFCALYGGEGFLMAAYTEKGRLFAPEFLGDRSLAPAILAALGVPTGKFRTSGSQPFSMYYPLTSASVPLPSYLGLALD